MNNAWLIAPPVTFLIILVTVYIVSSIFSLLATKNPKPGKGQKECYACGENMPGGKIKSDYSSFFPFAFFFTIIHVVALVIATVPSVTVESYAIVLMYIIGSLIGLSILFRKVK